MAVKIPKDIQREIGLLRQGIKIKKKSEKRSVYYSPDQIFYMAILNLRFLNELAGSEPVSSFLDETRQMIMVLDSFSSSCPPPDQHFSLGRLILKKVNNEAALYYWLDIGYQPTRDDKDCYLVTEEELRKWHPNSLRRFALLTKEEIWRNIKGWLRFMRNL